MRTLLCLVLIFELSVIAAALTAVPRSFEVTLADGSDTKLVVSDNSGVIEFRKAHAVAFTIPADSITEIIHVTHHVRRSTKAYNRLEEMCCGGTNSHVLSLVAMAVAAPLGHAQDHFVEIYWGRNGDETVLLKLGKNDYIPFMEWLQQKSGTKWRDVDQERERALKTIDQRRSAAFLVPIRYSQEDGAAAIHSYSVLALDDRDSTQLFFFNGEVKPMNLVSIVPVTREWSENTCVYDVKVSYGECREDRCAVEAILLPTLTYRIAKPRQQAMVSKGAGNAESPCAQVQQQEMEWGKRTLDKSRPTLKRPQ